ELETLSLCGFGRGGRARIKSGEHASERTETADAKARGFQSMARAPLSRSCARHDEIDRAIKVGAVIVPPTLARGIFSGRVSVSLMLFVPQMAAQLGFSNPRKHNLGRSRCCRTVGHGILSRRCPMLRERFGDFVLEPPLSEAMAAIAAKHDVQEPRCETVATEQ